MLYKIFACCWPNKKKEQKSSKTRMHMKMRDAFHKILKKEKKN